MTIAPSYTDLITDDVMSDAHLIVVILDREGIILETNAYCPSEKTVLIEIIDKYTPSLQKSEGARAKAARVSP